MSASKWRILGRLLAGLLLAWAGAAAARGPLYLWELADRDGRPQAWLYGTIHVCDAACFPLPAPVQAALAAADSLALELDPDDPALAPRLREAAVLPAGQRLDQQLPAALRPRLRAVFARFGLPADAMQRLQPWMVGTVLTVQAAQRAGFASEQGVDLWLARSARARGLPLWALETPERQIEALAAGGQAAQVAALVEMVAMLEQDASDDYFRRMLAAWRVGDAAGLDRLMREELTSAAMAPMVAALLDRRNHEMADAILARLAPGKRPFIAVGAAHLGGASGLLAEFAGRGYRVRQVEEDGE